jgi:hypothetical protein
MRISSLAAFMIVGFGCGPAMYAGPVSCPGNSSWDGSRCVGRLESAPGSSDGVAGDFVGEISVEGRTTRVETHLRSEGGSIGGNYVYAGNPGQFSNCQLSGFELSCTWTEGSLTGTFRVLFVSDNSSFSGNWDFSDGRPGGSWNGMRQGGAPAPAPVPEVATGGDDGSISGTYRGNIAVEGRLGPVVTNLSSSGGVISGKYTYGNTAGQFSNCRLAGNQLSCLWTEPGLSGGFRVDFASDLRSFSGSWDYSNGKPGGSWDGSR